MEVYLVGGAVRDKLLGIEPSDYDYVVVGSTPEEMLRRGFIRVGADFPVFIHPKTGDEYSLARTEGNCAFRPEVTLKEDLGRRDLTINAMALDLANDDIIDPFGGEEDLEAGILRPTTEAFLDDPIRLLRAARFSARFPKFTLSRSLLEMKEDLMESGELDHLTPERVWKELEKALMGDKPSDFFEFLKFTGVFPEVDALAGLGHPEKDVFTHVMMALDAAAEAHYDPLVRFGILCHDLGKDALSGSSKRHEDIVKDFCERLKVPSDYKRMGMLAAKLHVHSAFEMKPNTILKFMANFRSREEFLRILNVAICDKKGQGGDAPYVSPCYLIDCWDEAHSVISADISGPMIAAGKNGVAIGKALRKARINKIANINKGDY